MLFLILLSVMPGTWLFIMGSRAEDGESQAAFFGSGILMFLCSIPLVVNLLLRAGY